VLYPFISDFLLPSTTKGKRKNFGDARTKNVQTIRSTQRRPERPKARKRLETRDQRDQRLQTDPAHLTIAFDAFEGTSLAVLNQQVYSRLAPGIQ
jgi:hypothetical protein